MQLRFKTGMLAMLSPLVSAITDVGKEIVKLDAVAATAAVALGAAGSAAALPTALLLAAPVALTLVGKGAEKLCDRAADKFNESSLNQLCFASLAVLLQDLHSETESRPAEDRETLAMWHELIAHAAKDKSWAALLAATELPPTLLATWVINRQDPRTLWPGIKAVLEAWLAAARWFRANPSAAPPFVPFAPQPNSLSEAFDAYLSTEIPSRWLAALRHDVTAKGQVQAFHQLQLEVGGLVNAKLDRLVHHAAGPPNLTSLIQLRKRLGNGLVSLLRPQHPSALTFVGREDDRALLRNWRDSPNHISIRCIVGKGGAGKTRLAIDLLASTPDYWDAGFVSGDSLASFLQQRGFGEWEWTRPTLLVIDYAASQTERLESIVKDLRDRDAWDLPPLRILLLERQADPNEGWYVRLSGPTIEGASELFHPVAPVRLSPLDVSSRRALFSQAIKACAAFENKIAPELPAQLPGLESEAFEDPLVVAMAGFTAVQKGISPALGLSRVDLAIELVAHEWRRIAELSAPQAPEPLLLHLAAYATLVGGIGDEFLSVVASEANALGYSGLPHALIASQASKIPLDSAIEPDIIGEAFVLLVLSSKDQDGLATIVRATKSNPEKTLGSLIRLAKDFWQRPEPLQWLTALVAEGLAGDSVLLYQMDAAIPDPCPIGLLPWALELTMALKSKIPRPTSSDDSHLPEYARLLNNLANRQSDVGRREEALANAEEAVKIRRELARRNEEAFLPDLAMSLGAMSQIYAGQSDWPSAHHCLAEAVQSLLPLFEALPPAHTPLMLQLRKNYVEACAAAKLPPNEDWLARIAAKLRDPNP